MAAPRLADFRHDAVMKSSVGQYLDRLIREDLARGGEPHHAKGGSIIQQLWEAFHPEAPKAKKAK